jgi:hypothetical protein
LPTSSSSRRRPCDVCDNAFNGHRTDHKNIAVNSAPMNETAKRPI